MRVWSIWIAAGVLAAASCSKSNESSPAPSPAPASSPGGGPSTAGSADPAPPKSTGAPAASGGPSRPVVKKPVDSRPLPALAADKGGATGKPIWATRFGALQTENPRDLKVTPSGDVYVVGYFDADTDINGEKFTAPQLDPGDPLNTTPKGKKQKPTSDAFLVKLAAGGKIAWARTWGAKRDDDAKGVAVRGDTVLVVGNFLDELKIGELGRKSFGSDDLFVAAFKQDGNVQWVWTAGGIDSDGANTVAATPDGGWVIGGSFSNTASFFDTKLTARGGTDAMLIKLSAAGDLEWIKQFGGSQNDTIMHLVVDRQGSIYIQGQFRYKADWGGGVLMATGGPTDIVVAKYDLNGDHVWSQKFGNTLDDTAGGIAVDPAGNLTIVGGFEENASFGEGDDHRSHGLTDAFVARLTNAGKLAWARTFGGNRDDFANGVDVDAAGNAVVTGWFVNEVDFGGKSLTSKNRNKDAFAIKLDAKGNTVWAQGWGDKDHDQGRAVAIDDKGSPIVAGLFRFALELDKITLQSARAEDDRIPNPDAFVVKLER